MEFLRRNRAIILWSILLAMPVATAGLWLMKLMWPHGGFIALFGGLLTLPMSLGLFAISKVAVIPSAIRWEIGFVMQACGIFLLLLAIATIRRRRKGSQPSRPIGAVGYTVFAVLLLALNLGAGRVLEDLSADFEDFPAVPTKFVVGQIIQAKNDLPPDGKIDFAQLAFARGKLYVASMIGVIEIDGTRVEAIYRWQKNVSRVDNVWPGPAGRSLWIQHRVNNSLTLLDDAGWHNMQLPDPKDGYYSRGDMLRGSRAAATESGFWFALGKYLWSWEGDPAKWVAVPLPPGDTLHAVLGLHAGQKDPIVALGDDFLGDCKSIALLRKAIDRSWTQIAINQNCVKDLIGTEAVSYFRSKENEIFQVRNGVYEKLTAPGSVSAMTMDAGNALLAVVEEMGIYRYDGKWKKVYDLPYSKNVGEQFVNLTAHEGRIAIATSRSSHMKPGRSDQRIETGADALWVSDQGKLVRIEIPD